MASLRLFVRSLALLPLLGVVSCISVNRTVTEPPAPSGRTVVVPPGSTVTCTPGPCQER